MASSRTSYSPPGERSHAGRADSRCIAGRGHPGIGIPSTAEPDERVCSAFSARRRRKAKSSRQRLRYQGQKPSVAVALVAGEWCAMTAVCEILGVTRSNIAERAKQCPSSARGRPRSPIRNWWMMKIHAIWLQRQASAIDTRHLDGRIVAEQSNPHWYSDVFEIGCDNKE